MSYVAPIGIPDPVWGSLGNPVDLARPTPPVEWDTDTEVAGIYYVDETHGSASDANTYGTPDNPRVTIPPILGAGTIVFLNGDYSTNHATYPIRHTGTESEPCWILGYDEGDRPHALVSWALGTASSYLIISDIDYTWNVNATAQNFEFAGGVDHICLRNIDIAGTGISDPEDPNYTSADPAYTATCFPVQSSGSLTVNPTEQLVWWNVHITNTGNWMFAGGADIDGHGISMGFPIKDCWVVNCSFAYSTGCAIQIGAGTTDSTPDVDSNFRIYVGLCEAHHISQSAFWSKRSSDCVFSQNTAHTIRRDNPESPNASGYGSQYGARNCWFIYNTVHGCQHGIFVAGGAEGAGTSNTDNYFVGNLLYNIRDEVGTVEGSYRTNTSSPNGGTAIVARSGLNNYLVNNTLYDYDAGFLCAYGSGRDMVISGNIFASHNDAVAYADINVAEPDDVFITDNIFTGTPWICTDTAEYDTFAEVVAEFGATNINATPTFESAGSGDFRLASGSAGIDAIATEHPIYDLWETMYPTRPTIRLDRSGGERPWDATLDEPGGEWDIGAYEFGAAIPPPPPDAPTFSLARHVTPSVPHSP